MTLCIIKLAFSSSTCEDTSVWISILSSLVGYILPPPQIVNKIISTKDRVFMAVVGPSGSGKTQLIFNMLLWGTFQPRFSKILFCYIDFQFP